MADLVPHVGQALLMAVGMFWQVGWSLVLGFAISAILQAVVSKESMTAALGRDGVREIALTQALCTSSRGRGPQHVHLTMLRSVLGTRAPRASSFRGSKGMPCSTQQKTSRPSYTPRTRPSLPGCDMSRMSVRGYAEGNQVKASLT
jgi:hypothetical protein